MKIYDAMKMNKLVIIQFSKKKKKRRKQFEIYTVLYCYCNVYFFPLKITLYNEQFIVYKYILYTVAIFGI